VSRLDDLRAAILAAPDDDEPRLIYADALLEEGDRRGEFIQIQIKLAAGAAGDDEPALIKRSDELLERWQQTWRLPYQTDGRLTYRRGFIWETTKFDADMFAAEPIESLAGPELPLPDSVLARLRKLDVLATEGDELARAIGRGKLPRLRALTVVEDGPQDRAVGALEGTAVEELMLGGPVAELPALPLRSLDVCNALPKWLDRLALERMESLAIPDMEQEADRRPPGISPEELRRILGRMPRLRTLDLRRRRLPRGVLASWPGLRTLTTLRYDGHDLEDLVAAAPRLRELSFEGKRIHKVLAAGPYPEMRVLDLIRFTADAPLIEKILAAMPNLGRLLIQPRDAEARELLGQHFPVYAVVKPRDLPSMWDRYYPR
jgi:uncharacterized protein (TIGR02996 family)